MCEFEILIGKTLTKIVVDDAGSEDQIIFYVSDGTKYRLYHEYNCCESVDIDDICGDLDDLIGSPIISAREDISSDKTPAYIKIVGALDESYTWTFYNIFTAKGHVTIRWYGASNGWYSESVDFELYK